MAGIYGIFADGVDREYPWYNYLFSSRFDRIANSQTAHAERGVTGRSSLKLYEQDRFEVHHGSAYFMNEGILLGYDRNELPERFIKDYNSKPETFFTRLAGSYCGCIVSEHVESVLLYSDFMGTRPLFYYFDTKTNRFVFSSELKFFPPVLNALNLACEPNELAWKELALNGYLIGSHTLIRGVQKLARNSLLRWNRQEGTVVLRSQGEDVPCGDSEQANAAFLDRVADRLEWTIRASREKDLSYGYSHLQALSGGLDSRVNAGIAHKLGYTASRTLTFTQSQTYEEHSARSFARHMGMNHEVTYLDGGHYLTEDLLATGLASDGLVKIHGGAHQYHNMRRHSRQGEGMFHTGQIGDVVFGSFTYTGKPVYERVRKQAFFRDDALFDSYFRNDERIERYAQYGDKAYTRYALEERMVNSAFNGDQVCYHFTDAVSPFSDRKLINLVLALPASDLERQQIYFRVLARRFPYLLETRLDRSFFAPSRYRWYTAGNLLMRAWKKVNRREHMNPYDVWFSRNATLKKWLGETVATLMEEYGTEPLIRELARARKDSITGHLQPLTLLVAYDTHFGKRLVWNSLSEHRSQ